MSQKRFHVLGALAVLAGSFFAAGSAHATYYVSTNGSDSYSCSQAQNPGTPKQTINNMLDNCFTYGLGEGANKILEIAGGTYAENVIRGDSFPRGSSMNEPFTMRAAAGETVIIRPNGGGLVFHINSDPSFLPFNAVIQGITFDGTNVGSGPNTAAFSTGSALNVRFTGNTFTGNNLCIANTFMASGTGLEFVGNTMNSSHTGVYPCGAYQMYVGTPGALIEGNNISNFPDIGIHLYGYYGCPVNVTIRNNILHDFDWNDQGRGIANAIVACGTGHQIYNNLIYNGESGINVFDNSSAEVFNNTVYNMSHSGITAQNGASAVVRNNIAYSASAPVYGNIFDWGNEPQTWSNNLCGQSGSGCNLVGNPNFANPSAGDFRLTSSQYEGIGACGTSGPCPPGSSAPSSSSSSSSSVNLCGVLWDVFLPVPANFGASFNLFSSARELLMRVSCPSQSSANVSIGNGYIYQYIYKTGYIWSNNQWTAFNYSGTSMTPDGNWLKGRASYNLSGIDITQKQSVLAYICEWTNSTWKCGCNSSACTQNFWNLQQFKQ